MSFFMLLVQFVALIVVVHRADAQCYKDSDISIYQSGFKTAQFQESNDQCLANYTVVSASIIDDSASKGITCSRKDSTATGTWTLDGVEVDCSDTTGPVRCTRQQPGSVTLYTAGPYNDGGDTAVLEGNYKCCIDGLCISIRLWQFATIQNELSFNDRVNSRLDSCTFIPPSDITAIPQQYMIQMTTSVFPPSRLASFIDCPNCDSSVTLGESYYALIDLTNERYQFNVPVNWSVDSTTVQQYKCRIRFGGLSDSGSGVNINGQQRSVLVTASSAPSSVSHEVVNATAIRVSWSITGSVSGFVISIMSSGLDTVTEQLTDSTIREYVVDGLLPERDYTIAVRGYYQLLGPAITTTVRLEAGISSINGSLLSVSNDLSTQQIQVNCYTFRVEPNQVTWMIGSELIDSNYQPVNGSQLLDSVDQTYRHYITLNGSFSVGMSISCNTSVNGATSGLTHDLQAPSQPPSDLSATILSSSSLSISWMSVSGVDGYIVYYNGGEAVLIEGQDSANRMLNGLIKGAIYSVDVYSYEGFYSNTSKTSIQVNLDVPSISSLEAQSTTSDSVTLSWTIPDEGNIIDNYTLIVTRLCDNVVSTRTISVNGNDTQYTITGLYSGLQYTVGIIPLNILGTGMESNVKVIVMEGTDPPSGAPVLLVPVIINSTAISLSWGEVNCTERNGAITGYSVEYSIDGGIQSTTVNVTGDVTSIVIDGLTEFMTYTISVAAINSNGIGSSSNEHVVYTINTTLSGITTSALNESIQLSWNPLTTLTDVIYDYEVAYGTILQCTDTIPSFPTVSTIYLSNTTDTSVVVSGLISGTCYILGVRAHPSVPSVPGVFSVIIGATLSDAIESVATQSYVTSTQISWNVLPEYYLFEVGYIKADTNCSSLSLSILPQGYISYANTTNVTIEVISLDPNTCYVFGVRAHSTITNLPGEWTVTLNNTQELLVPSITPGEVASTALTLSWSPLTMQTSDMFVYQVGYSADIQCNDSIDTLPAEYTLFGNTTSNSIVVTGLEPDTCYVFGVRVYSMDFGSAGEWNILLHETLTQTQPISSTTATTVVTSSSMTFVTSSVTGSVTSSVSSSVVGTVPSSEPTVAAPNFALYGGAGGGGIIVVAVLLVVILLVVILLRRRSSSQSKTLKHNESKVHYQNETVTFAGSKPESDYVEMDVKKPLEENLYSSVDTNLVPTFDANAAIYANTDVSDGMYENPTSLKQAPFDPMIPETCPVSVDDLGRYVAENHFNENNKFKEQFKTLYTGDEKICDYGQREEFKLLNRFKNITVYDDNHIVLQPLPTLAQCTGFINAGYIDGFSVKRKYIACQGPLPKTVGDFWHMVWQEKVQFIVMLTNLMEEKKKKCARYWPEELNNSETYGHITVTSLEEEKLLHFVIRTLRVELTGTKESVIVKHFQYVTWPDYGVPESVSPFMTLRRRVMSLWNKDKGPVIVHCSAGVGRTGTFIAVDMALEQADKEKKVDIAGIVSRMRQQRMKMVQTDVQYAFLHDAVLESVMTGATEIQCDLFEVKLKKWRQPAAHDNKMKMQVQFELLSLVTPDQADVLKQSAEKYPTKNRMQQYLPPEKWRVPLKGEMPDYIHATFIDGFRETKSFIVAQSPLENTVRDFWKMIMDYKPSAIVMCCDFMENKQESCHHYWDQAGIAVYGEFNVEVLLVNQETGFVKRDLKVSDQKGSSVNVVHFQFTNWPTNGVTASLQTVLDVLEFIGRVQRRSGKRPVVVHCSDTIGRSGMFCAVSNALEQCKIEGLVDVFQATKAVRTHKPGAVTSLDQYNLLHDIILRYLDQNNTYSNFQNM